jgi:hypothetical protein
VSRWPENAAVGFLIAHNDILLADRERAAQEPSLQAVYRYAYQNRQRHFSWRVRVKRLAWRQAVIAGGVDLPAAGVAGAWRVYVLLTASIDDGRSWWADGLVARDADRLCDHALY